MSQSLLVFSNSSFFFFLPFPLLPFPEFLYVMFCPFVMLSNNCLYGSLLPQLNFKWGVSSSERLIYHPQYNSIPLPPKSSLIFFTSSSSFRNFLTFFGAYLFIYVYCLYLKHGAYVSLGKWFYLSHSVLLYHSLEECLAYITPCVNRLTDTY